MFLLIFNEFMKNGHQGIVRFERAGMEFQTVNVAFGESSLNIYKYDIPAGITGLYAASPFFGSSKITLKQNDYQAHTCFLHFCTYSVPYRMNIFCQTQIVN